MFFRAQESSRDVNPIHLMFDDERASLARSRDNDRSLPLFIEYYCFHLQLSHNYLYFCYIVRHFLSKSQHLSSSLTVVSSHWNVWCGAGVRCEIWKSEISQHQPPGKRKITHRNQFTHIDLSCSDIGAHRCWVFQSQNHIIITFILYRLQICE